MQSTSLKLIFLFLVVPSVGFEQQGETRLRTNLEILQAQIVDIAKEILLKTNLSPREKIVLSIHANESAWIFENALSEFLKKQQHVVFIHSPPDSGADVQWELGILDLSVSYKDPFHESFLGRKKANRIIRLSLSGNIRNAHYEVLFAGTIERTLRDTIAAADIPLVEASTVQFTHGNPLEEGFFENVLQPVVIIGASAVAIYLFFTIRS